ncbi:T9SS type A sorting domain-containing protein [Flavicella sp.]|uniref:T9SS type A sorting domain-containing protein n=1 Tax=Flavicella sp. TaxID=2957742 RepID=UPI00260F5A33|nr:T9SS type A sorting domain-containing protein [Flavicella sp.]MDG1805933.1 T9SS type A sorting domain-containing protein [Flavicella sp.]
MIKNYTHFIFFLALWSTITAQEQTQCDKSVQYTVKLLESKSSLIDYKKLYDTLLPCADMGIVEAQNYIAMFHLNGLGVPKNNELAFRYFEEAAKNSFAVAQYNLGRMYKYGLGCEINFVKAIEWFDKATSNGHSRAAFALGYMCFKGFAVDQDYQKAIAWFQKSNDVMATHYLGICYYFGYGTPVNEEKAIELLLDNPIENSRLLLAYIASNKQTKRECEVIASLQKSTDTEELVSEFVNKENTSATKLVEKNDLLKNWHGSLVKYDWSGQKVLSVSPMELVIEENADLLKVVLSSKKGTVETNALWQEETLYLQNMKLELDLLYPEPNQGESMQYSLMSFSLKEKEFNNKTFLVGAVDSYLQDWQEYGEPMQIILSADGVVDEEEIAALQNQEAQFIKLYPVPFKDDLLIQYKLEEETNVLVELTSYSGDINITIDKGVKQVGKQVVRTSLEIPKGMYILKVSTDSKKYSRMIVKE